MTFQLTIKTAEELKADAADALRMQIADAIDEHIEARAKALGYKSGAQLCGYAGSTIDTWRDEARAFITWRDEVWQQAFALADDPDSAVASSAAQVIAALPPWRDPTG